MCAISNYSYPFGTKRKKWSNFMQGVRFLWSRLCLSNAASKLHWIRIGIWKLHSEQVVEVAANMGWILAPCLQVTWHPCPVLCALLIITDISRVASRRTRSNAIHDSVGHRRTKSQDNARHDFNRLNLTDWAISTPLAEWVISSNRDKFWVAPLGAGAEIQNSAS